MVGKKIIGLATVMIFMFASCISANIQIEETATSINTLETSTYIATQTNTAMPTLATPTATLIAPTATMYLTPLPTLSFEQEEIKFYQFYNFINGCRLPCLWGITPGVTTWTEMEQFIGQFNYHNHIDRANWSITKTANFDTYGWAVHNPNSGEDFDLSVLMEVQNNIVTAILVDNQLSKILFPLYRLLDEYGKPDKILLDAIKGEGNITVYFVDVSIFYEDEYVFSGYRFYEYGSTKVDSRRVCLHESLGAPLTLWSSGRELNRDFSRSKLLNEFSDENEKTFHERFRYKGNKCFEVSKDAWE